MIFSVYWRWFAALLCLLSKGDVVRCVCTEENMQIEGGEYTLSQQLEEGSILKYQCPDGFYPFPHLVRTCSHDGRWDPAPKRFSPQKCKLVECPDPTVLENGNIWPNERNYFFGNQTTHECYSGYKLYGPFQRTCLSSGKWSGPHPVCRRDSGDNCPDPGIPPGGSRTGSLFDIGEKVIYSCTEQNMILIGSEERVCQENGRWSGKEPTCYYKHTYDTPQEVSYEFGGEIKHTLSTLETNVTQEGRVIKLTKSGILNIFIGLDVSASISQKHFENAKTAVLTLIEKISSFSVNPNYEVLFFSSKPHEAIDILSFFNDNKKSLADLLIQLKNYKIKRRDQAGTNLNDVFKAFLEKIALIKQQQENFKEHQHVIIIFTDGAYNMGGKPTQTVNEIKSMVYMNQEMERLEHLDIYIFGIGDQIYDANLIPLTVGTGGKHYFRLQNLEKLHETFDEIINEDDVRGLCGLYRDFEDMEITENKRKKFPWVMSVSVLLPDKTSYCLGSLVSPRFVLTAAHCFTVDNLIEKIKVEVLNDQLDVKEIHMHPNYNISVKKNRGVKEFYDYDVALIELVKDVPITTSVRPICIPCTAETNGALRQVLTCTEQEQFLITNNERLTFLTKKNFYEKNAVVKLGGNRPDCISKALLAPGINTTDLSEVVNDNFLCTGGTFPEVDKIACKGDSGGAVFKNYQNRTIQVALVSWGNKLMEDCDRGGNDVKSDKDSRDFHFNIFKAVPFLKSILGKEDQSYAPLVFVD